MTLEFIPDLDTKYLFNSIKAQYKTETGNDLEIGSNEFAIASAVAYVFGGIVNRFNDMAANRYIDTARGEYLDALAKNLGVTRPSVTYAKCLVLVVNSTQRTLIVSQDTATLDDGKGHEFEPDFGGSIESITVPAGELRAMQFRSKTNDESNNGIALLTMRLRQEFDDGVVEYLQATDTAGANPNAYPYTTDGDDAFRAMIPDMAARVRSAGSQAYYNAWCRQYSPYILDAYCLVDGDADFVPGTLRIFVSMIDGTEDWGAVLTGLKMALEAEQNRPINDFVADVSLCGEEYQSITYEVHFDPMLIGRDKAAEIASTACQRLKDYYMRNIGKDVASQRFNEIIAVLDADGGILAARQLAQYGEQQSVPGEIFPVQRTNIASKTFNYQLIEDTDR